MRLSRYFLPALKEAPADAQIISHQLMLRAGFPDKAVSLLETLAKQGDPQKRLDALYDLARVHEHADQFAKADQALRDGLGLLDFRDARYAEFFLRRVRLHERSGTLEDLRTQLLNQARQQPAREQALFDMAIILDTERGESGQKNNAHRGRRSGERHFYRPTTGRRSVVGQSIPLWEEE